MERVETMIRIVAAGLGCRRNCPAREIADLVRLALERADIPVRDLSGLFAPSFKQGEAGLALAAADLGVPLILLPETAMKEAEPRILTRSERVIALTGFGSIAETAALAGAGTSSRLIQPRLASASATCAIAVSG